MTVQGQLKAMLKAVAVALGDDLRARLVFIGECTTALYMTDPMPPFGKLTVPAQCPLNLAQTLTADASLP
jgi:hypothetical protein